MTVSQTTGQNNQWSNIKVHPPMFSGVVYKEFKINTHVSGNLFFGVTTESGFQPR